MTPCFRPGDRVIWDIDHPQRSRGTIVLGPDAYEMYVVDADRDDDKHDYRLFAETELTIVPQQAYLNLFQGTAGHRVVDGAMLHGSLSSARMCAASDTWLGAIEVEYTPVRTSEPAKITKIVAFHPPEGPWG